MEMCQSLQKLLEGSHLADDQGHIIGGEDPLQQAFRLFHRRILQCLTSLSDVPRDGVVDVLLVYLLINV